MNPWRVVRLVAPLVVCVLGGCTTTPDDAPADTATQVVSVVVIGDSVTAADSPDVQHGDFGRGSWAFYADDGQVDVLGGWAVSGATTQDMARSASGWTGDVLVLMGGTNDLRQGLPTAQTTADLEALADQNPAQVVVLCTIVPSRDVPEATQALNAELETVAATHGWDFLDCAAPVRADDGDWLPGDSEDGVHPMPRAAEMIGDVVHDHVVELLATRRLTGTGS